MVRFKHAYVEAIIVLTLFIIGLVRLEGAIGALLVISGSTEIRKIAIIRWVRHWEVATLTPSWVWIVHHWWVRERRLTCSSWLTHLSHHLRVHVGIWVGINPRWCPHEGTWYMWIILLRLSLIRGGNFLRLLFVFFALCFFLTHLN